MAVIKLMQEEGLRLILVRVVVLLQLDCSMPPLVLTVVLSCSCCHPLWRPCVKSVTPPKRMILQNKANDGD